MKYILALILLASSVCFAQTSVTTTTTTTTVTTEPVESVGVITDIPPTYIPSQYINTRYEVFWRQGCLNIVEPYGIVVAINDNTVSLEQRAWLIGYTTCHHTQYYRSYPLVRVCIFCFQPVWGWGGRAWLWRRDYFEGNMYHPAGNQRYHELYVERQKLNQQRALQDAEKRRLDAQHTQQQQTQRRLDEQHHAEQYKKSGPPSVAAPARPSTTSRPSGRRK